MPDSPAHGASDSAVPHRRTRGVPDEGAGSPSQPAPTELIIGIDLGTTNSLVAIAGWPGGSGGPGGRVAAGDVGDASAGESPGGINAASGASAPRIIPDEHGRMLLPSVVRYDVRAGSSAGAHAQVVAVGHDAKECAVEFPRTTIASVKRLMGRSLDDARPDLPYLTFEVIEGPHRTARVYLPTDAELGGAAGMGASAGGGGGAVVSPQEVSAVILRRLREQAERALGVPLSKTVVTVPAYFDDAQRQATRDAGRLAGLDVVRIVNEPTAAALAYGIGVGIAADAAPRVVAVYDLGGGTFDVSILRLTPSMQAGGMSAAEAQGPVDAAGAGVSAFQVLATAGDTHLGGDDCDHALVRLFSEEIRARFAPPGGFMEFPAATRRALLRFAEQTKIRLSDADEARVRIDLGSAQPGGPGGVYERTITRAEFEGLIAPLVERTIAACRRALRDARRGMDDAGETVSTVVLVGGATRTPLVRRRVREFFGVEPYVALDPDIVVALGAAVQGALLSGRLAHALLLDVVPLSLGIETVGGAAAKLIMRNAPVPTQASERFSTSVDGQTSIRLHVLQGEREMAADCRSLGVFHLSGIPPMPAGIPRLLVTFSLDVNGILHVSAVEERSGKVSSLQIVPNHGLTRDEVQRIEAESFQHAGEDMARHRVVDLVAHSRLDLHWIRQGLSRVGHALEPAYRADLEAVASTLQAFIDRASADWKLVDAAEFHRAKETLDRASVRLHEVSIAESLRGSGT